MSSVSNSIDPIDGFDLGKYRYAVAKYIKLMIRARATVDPEFLSGEQLDRWNLSDIDSETDSLDQLLQHAQAACDHLWRTFIGPHGSGGISTDDPRAAFKSAVNQFATPAADVLRQLKNDEEVDWENVAKWELLDQIRDGLDSLPGPGVALPEVAASCPVVIVDAQKNLVRVLGESVTLTPARFNVMQALVEAHPGTLTKDELVTKSGHTDAVKMLKGLREKNAALRSVIKIAGMSYGGYGLIRPSTD